MDKYSDIPTLPSPPSCESKLLKNAVYAELTEKSQYDTGWSELSTFLIFTGKSLNLINQIYTVKKKKCQTLK